MNADDLVRDALAAYGVHPEDLREQDPVFVRDGVVTFVLKSNRKIHWRPGDVGERLTRGQKGETQTCAAGHTFSVDAFFCRQCAGIRGKAGDYAARIARHKALKTSAAAKEQARVAREREVIAREAAARERLVRAAWGR